MSDLYYEPKDPREIAADREHEDRHAAQDALEADGAYLPHNRHYFISEAERQQIENADALELSAQELIAEHRGVPSFNRETDVAMSWAERQDRDRLEWAERA